jgi:hypothetical protein
LILIFHLALTSFCLPLPCSRILFPPHTNTQQAGSRCVIQSQADSLAQWPVSLARLVTYRDLRASDASTSSYQLQLSSYWFDQTYLAAAALCKVCGLWFVVDFALM